MKSNTSDLKLIANAIRMLSAEAVQAANSGHPGLPMGAADYSSLLWSDFLRFNPEDPRWPNRDRFVLSAGHGCMLLYSLLHLFGYDMPEKDLRRFRQWESKTPGHPEFGVTSGVETTTGPLGQGFANGVGMALSGKLLAQEYSQDLFNFRVFGVVSDGDLMEGIASEAASLAGHLALDNLIYIYDDNHISIGGKTEVCFTESVAKRFEAYNWFVQSANGHNVDEMRACIERALAEPSRPSIICARTTIGLGAPNKAGDPEVHGAALGEKELELTRQNLKWSAERFFVPPEVRTHCAQAVQSKKKEYDGWQKSFADWQKNNPEKSVQWEAQTERRLPAALKGALLDTFKEPKKDATRNLSGQAIQTIAKHLPWFVGGSADLEPSTKTLIKGSPDIQPQAFKGRNIRFGVREHAMGGIANGLAYQGCWTPYTATFLVFSDYMRPSIRLAAISNIQTLFIFTHESFYVGEDGPTHEPVEHTASLRLIPHLNVYRPADGVEIAMCYYQALERRDAPSTLLFTRQNVAPLERAAGFNPDVILKGAYVLQDTPGFEMVLIATGSEVSLAVAAAKLLAVQGKKVRVVSMPCVEEFLKQDRSWRETIIPSTAKRVSIEAGVTCGWERIVGDSGLTIGLDRFGASAPFEVLAEKFGFTPEAVRDRILRWE